MTKNDCSTPKQIVCTGEAGSDEWNCAFGTWEADEFGIESDEPVGEGERLFVSRDLYDDLANRLGAALKRERALLDNSDRCRELLAEINSLKGERDVVGVMNLRSQNKALIARIEELETLARSCLLGLERHVLGEDFPTAQVSQLSKALQGGE